MNLSEQNKSLLLKIGAWTAVLAAEAAVLMADYGASSASEFLSRYLRGYLLPTLHYAALFFIHDLLLLPILMRRRKVAVYALSTVLLLVFFCISCIRFRSAPPRPDGDRPRDEFFSMGEPPSEPFGMMPPEHRPDDLYDMGAGDRGGEGKDMGGMHPMDPAVTQLLLALLLIGGDLGWGYCKRYYSEKSRLEMLEAENRQYRTERVKTEVAASSGVVPGVNTAADAGVGASAPAAAGAAAANNNAAGKVVFFKADSKIVKVNVEDICYIESMSEYLKIYVQGEAQPKVVLMSFQKLFEKLPSSIFVRVHRSYALNLAKVVEVSNGFALMEGGKSLPISDSYKAQLLARLNY